MSCTRQRVLANRKHCRFWAPGGLDGPSLWLALAQPLSCGLALHSLPSVLFFVSREIRQAWDPKTRRPCFK